MGRWWLLTVFAFAWARILDRVQASASELARQSPTGKVTLIGPIWYGSPAVVERWWTAAFSGAGGPPGSRPAGAAH